MAAKLISIDQSTLKLANELKSVLARYSQDDSKNYQQILTSALIALCIELGRLRFLATSTNEVSEDNFDQILWEIVIDNYNDNVKRHGVLN